MVLEYTFETELETTDHKQICVFTLLDFSLLQL